MEYSLGVDFGTSGVKVSIRQEGRPPVALPISVGGDEPAMPSVVSYSRTSKNTAELYAVGEDAEMTPTGDDFIIIRDIKRVLETVDNPPRDFPYHCFPWWDIANKRVQLWRTTLKVDDVIQVIFEESLRRAVRRARDLDLVPQTRRPRWQRFLSMIRRIFVRQPENKVLPEVQGWHLELACSVTAGLESRTILRRVAQHLGFVGFRFEQIREEPVLASLPYLQREVHPGETVLVYDFGGGTFDSAVIRVEQTSSDALPSITVLSTEGSPFCGGVDIDRRFGDHLARRIAQEYFGDESEERYREIMEHGRSQLVNLARAAKESLSGRTEFTVSARLDFLSMPAVELTVTRNELERAIQDSGVLKEADICVLCAWRKARMILRQGHEVGDPLVIEKDVRTGAIVRTILDLGFDDLSEMVDRILIVGGTTKIPLVRAHLGSLFRNVQFITEEDPYEPIVACALGAASQKAHVNSVVDRLPFSIIVNKEDGAMEMYRAYARTFTFDEWTKNPPVTPYVSRDACLISSTSDWLDIHCVTPDGEIIAQTDKQTMLPGRHPLKIDMLGRIGLGNLSVPNLRQHRLQLDMLYRMEQEKQRLEDEERDRARIQLYKKPGEELGER